MNEIGSERYLYLTSIGEPEDNTLRLIVEAARVSGSAQPIDPSLPAPGEASAIVSDETTPAWEVVFDACVAYAVLNESFALPADEDEVWTGPQLFRRYSKSRFLDYVRAATLAFDDHPGPLQHFEINCLSHVVQVVCVSDPRITKIRDGRGSDANIR